MSTGPKDERDSHLTFILHRAQRNFCAAEILAFPAAVFGPVDRPPWYLHFDLPGMTFFLHGPPERVRAPH